MHLSSKYHHDVYHTKLCFQLAFGFPGLIFTMLEDVVEAATIDECQAVFDYMEMRVSVLRKPHLFDGKLGGKLIMLRCCNQLQRRLSKVCDTRSLCICLSICLSVPPAANFNGSVFSAV